MKKGFGKLKLKMLLYFMLFAVIIICFLWIFQMVFFESYYQSTKFENMKIQCEKLKEVEVKSEKFYEIENACSDLGIDVYVFNHQNVFYSSSSQVNLDMRKVIGKAVTECAKSDGNFSMGIEPINRSLGIFYYSTQKTDGSFIVLTSSHSDFVETISAIRSQFIYTTIVVLIIGVILAWFLANRLSKPICEMSETAKKWADGDNDVSFSVSGNYAEINELADTLNYAKDSVSKSGILQRDLLANVSHDLKTPLTMIKAYAEMIRDISGDKKEKRDVHTQVIMDEADRLTMLVNDILNLSKLQASVDSLQMKEINLSLLVERVIDRFAPFVQNKGYVIENYVAPDLLTVVDEQKIEQVIYNLLGNSINYTGEDKVVKVYLTAENDSIILEIIDSGKGISQEKLETIWERYYRFSETNTRPVKGTGLGLSIVKTVLDAHNLKFGVRSKKDCGSNFYVEFNRVKNE